MTAESTDTDPVAGFAALMSGAASEAGAPAGEAPFGYTRDEKTGEMRPKKAPGRPRKSPPVEDLKARHQAQMASGADAETVSDRPPAASKAVRGRGHGGSAPDRPVPQKYRAEGSIARAVNQLYRKAGKMVRVVDAEVGQALIDITRPVDDDDVTVGDAWEALARSNPRVRVFLLRVLAGGAWSGLVAAHLPVVAAVLMKDSVRRRIPFARLAQEFVAGDGDGDGAPAEGTAAAGLRPEDLAQMMAMARAAAEQAAARAGGVPSRGGETT